MATSICKQCYKLCASKVNYISRTGIYQRTARPSQYKSCVSTFSTTKLCSKDIKDVPTNKKKKLPNGPSLEHFITNSQPNVAALQMQELHQEKEEVPYLDEKSYQGAQRKVFFDVYGCQMNVNDTEIVWGILQQHGFQRSMDITNSDIILIMTCSIRERAEEKIWNRLEYYKYLKRRRYTSAKRAKPAMKIGILGCMAERLKRQIVEKEQAVDVVCGPDAYRSLPRMLADTQTGQAAVNVLLSLEETYADVVPVRLNTDSPSAFVSIMRGCDNMCSYCIVPFTRGRERSRPISSILDEVRCLSDQGIKEITLLGQNVNSYRDKSEHVSQGGSEVEGLGATSTRKGFSTVYKPKTGGKRFSELLDKVSLVDPEMRIRFTSPHPKDFPDEVLHLINERPNICNQLHLPAQSGSSETLERMRRGYTREAYIELVDHIKNIIPNVSLTSDFIAGFCEETEDDHKQTLSLMHYVKYNFAYCFPYSMRQKTRAFHHLNDNVPQDVKKRRHMELVEAFRHEAEKLNHSQIGEEQLVLVEGISKRSGDHLAARNDGNTKVIIPRRSLTDVADPSITRSAAVGDYVVVQITDASSQTLIAKPLYLTTLTNYHRSRGDARSQQSSHLLQAL